MRLLPLVLLMSVTLSSQTASWLDRPLTNWNTPATTVTKPETLAEKDLERCALAMPRDTAPERALANAGWVPFHMFDRQIVERDVEIVGGLSASDGMCRPMRFNVFVFVNGNFAGTLSPTLMDSRMDGVVGGGIRVGPDDVISAEFARYTDKDALCCPSGRVRIQYRIERTASSPVVVPVSAQSIR